jgi:putrescine transport system substrate-binding protein
MLSRILPLTLGVAASMFVSSAPTMAQEKTVNVYNWSDYIGETTLDDFTKTTGIKVNYDVYDNNEIVETKLSAGQSGYDIVVPTAQPFLTRLIKNGALQKLDKAKIPNLANLDQELMKQVQTADPNNDYAIIYQWGTIGLGYNKQKIAEFLGKDVPLDSYDLLFKDEYAEKIAKCGIAVLDSSSDIMPVVFNYLGLDPNSRNKKDLDKATDLMSKARKHIRYFHSSKYINDLASGEICMAMAFSGDVSIAGARAAEAKKDFEIGYIIPKEGTLMWFDTMAIPAGAPNNDAAHAYINFMLEPKVMAGITNYVFYANAVPKSLEFVSDDIKNDTNIFPTEEVKKKLFVATPVDDKFERLLTRSWTKIRTGK